jgi:hypothetical protein
MKGNEAITGELTAWEWAVLVIAGAVFTIGWGLVIAAFFAAVLAATRAIDGFVAAGRGPRLPPRRVRLARLKERRDHADERPYP